MPPTPSPDPTLGRFEFVVAGVRYESTQFRVVDGLRLSLTLTALGGEAVAAVLGSLGGGASLSSALDAELGAVDLSKLRGAFLDGTIERWILDVLRQTYRDGVSLDSSKAGNGLDQFRPPSGNFFDLYAVAAKVVEGNGWLPLPAGLLDELAGAAKAAIVSRLEGGDDSAPSSGGSATD